MFEKEAEEYTLKRLVDLEDFDSYQSAYDRFENGVQDAFKDGADFGYNKANEWHYVKDELPKDNEYVLIYTNLNNCYVARKVENHFMSKGWGFIPMSTVIAWKEIVPPKESE